MLHEIQINTRAPIFINVERIGGIYPCYEEPFSPSSKVWAYKMTIDGKEFIFTVPEAEPLIEKLKKLGFIYEEAKDREPESNNG